MRVYHRAFPLCFSFIFFLFFGHLCLDCCACGLWSRSDLRKLLPDDCTLVCIIKGLITSTGFEWLVHAFTRLGLESSFIHSKKVKKKKKKRHERELGTKRIDEAVGGRWGANINKQRRRPPFPRWMSGDQRLESRSCATEAPLSFLFPSFRRLLARWVDGECCFQAASFFFSGKPRSTAADICRLFDVHSLAPSSMQPFPPRRAGGLSSLCFH